MPADPAPAGHEIKNKSTETWSDEEGTGSPRASPSRRRPRPAALGAVLLGPHKPPLVPPAIYAAQRASRSRPCPKRGRLYRRAARSENSQRLGPSYTVSPAGQRLKHRAPPREPRKPVTSRAPNQPLWGDVRFSPDCFRSTPDSGRGRHPRGMSQPDPGCVKTIFWRPKQNIGS